MSEPTYTFEGLRGVGRVELSFEPDQRVYALFGTNGVGKTKCLEALFQYYLAGCKAFMSYRMLSLTNEILVAQHILGPETELLAGPTGIIASQMAQALRPGAEFHSMPVVFLGAGQRGHVESGLTISEPIGSFEERRKRYFSSLVAGMQTRFSNLGMDSGLAQWFVTRAQSANPYQKGGDNRKIEIDTLLKLLNKIDDRYDPSFLEIDGANQVTLSVAGAPTELRHLSTGFASLVKMLQAIISGYANFTNEVNLTHVKGVVFIDEIESHLHSEWQSKIVLLLKQLFPNTTFFIATHSPIVLSQLHEGEAYLLERKDGVVKSSVIRAPDKRILSDVLVDAMGINLNQLKLARLTSDSQIQTKARLRKLLLETPTESGDA